MLNACIRIGGKLDEQGLALLHQAIEAERYGQDDPGITIEEIRETALNERPVETCHLYLQEFEILEPFCQAHNLTYTKQAEGEHDEDGLIGYWKPGMPRPRSCFADQAGVPAITLDDLRKARATGATLASVIQSLREPLIKVPPLILVKEVGGKHSLVRVAKDTNPAKRRAEGSAPKGARK
jgi:hypothetical protein